MNDEGMKSVGDLMQDSDHETMVRVLKGGAGIIIGIGLLFTGTLNFMLYSRAFTGNMQIAGIIPAILIEGSLALFLLGNLYWFSYGTQGLFAKVFGWLMFAIVALNTVIEFNARTGGLDDQFLSVYAFWGVPIVIPLVIGFWKAVLDSEPGIQVRRKRRLLAQSMKIAKMDAVVLSLNKQDHRSALEEYGDRVADEINDGLRGKRLAVASKAPGGLNLQVVGQGGGKGDGADGSSGAIRFNVQTEGGAVRGRDRNTHDIHVADEYSGGGFPK